MNIDALIAALGGRYDTNEVTQGRWVPGVSPASSIRARSPPLFKWCVGSDDAVSVHRLDGLDVVHD